MPYILILNNGLNEGKNKCVITIVFRHHYKLA